MIYYCYRKTTALQRIQLSVGLGSNWFAVLEIPPESIENVVKKLTARYRLDLSKDQKYRRRKAGLSVADLVVYYDRQHDKYRLFVLVTLGSDAMDWTQAGYENLQSVAARLRFMDQYELVYLTRKKSAMLNKGRSSDAPETWTWRMTDDLYGRMKQYLEKSVVAHPNNPLPLKQAVHILEQMPGLRGIRQQIGTLWAHTLKNWKHSYKADMPHTLNLHFMRMVGNDVDTLVELTAHVQRRAAALIAEQSKAAG
jgi:hypothetical protein